MIYALKGKIVDITEDSVAIDVHDVAYLVYTSRPYEFIYGEEMTLYTYEVYSENDHYLVGFSSKNERNAFLNLNRVKGIGPKTALAALSKATPENLAQAIESGNVSFLKTLPGIGPKAASQIILDLRGKIAISTTVKKQKDNSKYLDAKSALQELGFKAKDIDSALEKILDTTLKTDEIVRIALKYLRKGSI